MYQKCSCRNLTILAAVLFVLGSAIADKRPEQNGSVPQVILVDQNDPNSEAVIIPYDSPVKLTEAKDGDFGFRFIGQFVITGTYYYGYDEILGEDYPTLYIVPDQSSVTSLPYWKHWGRPKLIDLRNAEGFAKAALPPDIVSKIAKKKLLSSHGRISIVAKNYIVTGECDHPVFIAEFVSVYRPNTVVASKSYTASSC